MSLPQLARRYALALYETAVQRGEQDQVEADMVTVSRLFTEIPRLLTWCQNRANPPRSATTLVAEAFLPSVGRLTGATLKLAAQNGRLALLPWLPSAFQATVEARGASVVVNLETFQAPDPELVSTVRLAIESRTGRPATVVTALVPDLVGGFRVFWNHRLLDRSVRGRLLALRIRLNRPGGPP